MRDLSYLLGISITRMDGNLYMDQSAYIDTSFEEINPVTVLF
jgi:hypothetical protein